MGTDNDRLEDLKERRKRARMELSAETERIKRFNDEYADAMVFEMLHRGRGEDGAASCFSRVMAAKNRLHDDAMARVRLLVGRLVSIDNEIADIALHGRLVSIDNEIADIALQSARNNGGQ